MRAKPAAKKNNVIPVIFVLGVLGWGFFIIDRLTSSYNQKQPLSAQSFQIVQNNQAKDTSIWLNIKSFIHNLIYKENIYLDKIDKETKLANISPLPSANESLQKKIIEPIAEKNQKLFEVYLYKEASQKLIKVKQTFENITLKNIVTAIIQGPKISDQLNGYISTFPNKPRLINVSIKKGIAILNFDENFSKGISFQILKMQLKQLLLTAQLFPNIHSLQIQIHGENLIEIDGIEIPEVISSHTWPIQAIF